MTKPRGIRPTRVRLVALDDLPARILELLDMAPHTKHELEALTGWSAVTIDKRLRDLHAANFIYPRNVSINKGGIQQRWYAGDEPLMQIAAGNVVATIGSGEMKQLTVQQYEIHSFRNEFETYLFGPAHKEAA